MRDLKFVFGFLAILLVLMGIILWIFPPVSAATYYVQQGDILYVNSTIDISGVAFGIEDLAYYGYSGVEDLDTQYLLKLPDTKEGYYSFYLDPAIFSNRTGTWFKWNGKLEPNGNTVAFKIRPQRTAINASGAIVNISSPVPNQTAANPPRIPLLPVHHIADYLIARGNGFEISASGATSVWIFGARDMLLDQRTYNHAADIPAGSINTLSPGRYTVLMQETEEGYTGDSAIRYNNISHSIQWFDANTFTVQGFSILDQTPENILNKLKEVFPVTHNKYELFILEVQDPTISIDQIDSLNQLNNTGAPQAEGLIIGSQSYIDVRGYTNAEPGTLINVGVDIDFNKEHPWEGTIATSAQGDTGGDMREWKVLIPLKLLDMKPGRHFVSAKTDLSDAVVSTADFYIYDNPEGNVIPNKTIRYISGRYGPEEIVPTPTPLIITNIVKQTVVVTQTITIPVTPSNEQVKAQQDAVISEKLWFYGMAGGISLIVVAIVGYLGYAWIRGRKKKPRQPKKSEIDEFLGR